MEETRTEAVTDEQDHGPSSGIISRLLFVWFAVVATLWTIPMAIIQFVSHGFRPTAKNFKRNARWWGGGILTLAGIRTRVTDRALLDPETPYVFVANHQNLLDILALSAALPYPFGFLAKEELSRVPFLGFAIRHSASVFIDKRDPRSALVSLKAAGERIRNGMSVLVFVEGTRSYSRDLQPLKKGAFAVAVEAGVEMVPVVVVDAYRLMNEKKRRMRPGTIHIKLGKPISIEGKTRRDIPELMDVVRNRLSAELTAAHESSETPTLAAGPSDSRAKRVNDEQRTTND